jgi:hypothetical protein
LARSSEFQIAVVRAADNKKPAPESIRAGFHFFKFDQAGGVKV